jgi:hypothetical protein
MPIDSWGYIVVSPIEVTTHICVQLNVETENLMASAVFT